MRGDSIGKFLDQYRQLKRQNRLIRGRQKYLEQFPWYDGNATHINVVDALDYKTKDKDKSYEAEISEVGNGYSVGLMFGLASKSIIKEIKCPKCGSIAKLNVKWQGFKCDDAMWEMMKR